MAADIFLRFKNLKFQFIFWVGTGERKQRQTHRVPSTSVTLLAARRMRLNSGAQPVFLETKQTPRRLVLITQPRGLQRSVHWSCCCWNVLGREAGAEAYEVQGMYRQVEKRRDRGLFSVFMCTSVNVCREGRFFFSFLFLTLTFLHLLKRTESSKLFC